MKKKVDDRVEIGKGKKKKTRGIEKEEKGVVPRLQRF